MTFNLTLAADNLDEALCEGSMIREHTVHRYVAHAQTCSSCPTHTQEHKMKEERRSLQAAWSIFQIITMGEKKRPSVSTVGTLSGL